MGLKVGGLSKVKTFPKKKKYLKFTATWTFSLKRLSQTTKNLEDGASVSPDMGFTLPELPSLSRGCPLLG